MSLRNTLKAAVARCTPLEMQPAIFQNCHATGDATAAQQLPAIPHGIRVHAATVIATAMQQGMETSATNATSGEKLQVASPSACNTQHGLLIAHRLAAAVIEAAMRRCDQFGDGPAARAEMVKQIREVPVHQHPDLLLALGEKPNTPKNTEVEK